MGAEVLGLGFVRVEASMMVLEAMMGNWVGGGGFVGFKECRMAPGRGEEFGDGLGGGAWWKSRSTSLKMDVRARAPS